MGSRCLRSIGMFAFISAVVLIATTSLLQAQNAAPPAPEAWLPASRTLAISSPIFPRRLASGTTCLAMMRPTI